MKIMAVTHPIPEEYAKRIYDKKKTVFVSKRHLGKVSPGDKFILYESHGAGAYTGWADVKNMALLSPQEIIKEYKDALILNKKELADYANNKKLMNIIEFENFEKFKNPVVPKRFVSLSGKYVYEDEFKFISENKD